MSMEYVIQPKGQDSGARPVQQVGFDMLRTMIAARQSSCATVRALTIVSPATGAAHGLIQGLTQGEDAALASDSMALLTGRRASSVATMGGAFADHFAIAHPFVKEGESHG